MSDDTIRYDIPADISLDRRSPTFREFFRNWFEDSRALIRHELDRRFLKDLAPRERELACYLLQRNLKLRYEHIIRGFAALNCIDAVDELRDMVANEENESLRLTIAGVLWNLVKEPKFVECLEQMKLSSDPILRQAHFHQVMWLDDERSVDLMIDLLDDDDPLVSFMALSRLSELEFERVWNSKAEIPVGPEDYKRRRQDKSLRQLLVHRLRAHHARFDDAW